MKMKNKSHRFDINRPTILDKIFEIKQSNPVKLGRTRKVGYLLFLLLLNP